VIVPSKGESNLELEEGDCDDDDDDGIVVSTAVVVAIWYFRNSHVDTEARILTTIPPHPNIKMTDQYTSPHQEDDVVVVVALLRWRLLLLLL